MTLKEYKLALDSDEFFFESECGNVFNVQVDSRGNVKRIYNADNLLLDLNATLTQKDLQDITDMAYDFDYPQHEKFFDKDWNK